MLKSLLVSALIASFSFSALAVELKGHLTQGGLVTGQLNNAKSVSLNGKPLKLSDTGLFVFGFGRDAKPNHTLSWVDKSGKNHSQDLVITLRDYNIDKITGVAKKYVSPPKAVSERISREAVAVRKARAVDSDLEYFLQPVLRPAEGRISGVYGSQRYFNGEPRRPHFGLDIANKTGSPVYAPISGTVVFAEPDLYYSGGTLILDHGHGVTSTYIHLSKLDVKVGDKITQGMKVAEIGATGRVTGPHLDWRFNWQGERLDPALLMQDTLANKK
ncbi:MULTISPECIES: M23 family metallopeptidase [unclassified Pseudoalteromonas]|uniref:M23 family metallopeptidase n=1 Tax=unclassified Pseudoalteromonas TaxID=194690 RepID=UPI00110CCCCD|nr:MULTISPECIES: M23 family metallopeptidase [unclassified Pseudoalteromonas]MDN3393485.1 M23 family metallopeptidase [Pseudoalteromonas sp. APC 3215]MDN3401319.1 M23 family metallopeptidase [Pseudoalteromonas sp. APC 3213]MDN3411071.1 M23 family metallopeptidase [Pseudoalteromonas sp. APC 3250]MDN3430331.1 M23 family metallopeptidase [Pseudoalteromonas sp. APC 3907]MDN3464236.1 M23 family metallopeptidase [Pseudoalteromonas sp. APC 3495]